MADLPFFPNPGFKEQQLRQAEEKSRHRAEEEQAGLTEAEQPRRANEEHSPHTEERPVREAEPGREALHVSASPHAPTVAAAVLPARGGRGYLFALLIGVLASLFSVLLTSVLFNVDHADLVLLPLPPLALSLLTGVITGKRAVRHTAGLLAGLLVGISWFISLLSRFANGGITDPEWVTLVAGAATCGLFSWLVAWLTRGTTEVATRQPEGPRERLRFALLVGACAGLFSVLFTGVIYSVVRTVNFFYDGRVSLMLLPPLVLSLITGFLLGKPPLGGTALLAGLVVGVSWFVSALSLLVNAGIPYQEEWVTVVVCAATCGLLSWLVAWLTTRTHPDDLSSGGRNET